MKVIKDYRFFTKTQYRYEENYNDITVNGPTSTNKKVFDSIDDAISYAYSQGFTFRDSRGFYNSPGSTRYWVSITPFEKNLNALWAEEDFYEYMNITKYSGDKHLAAFLIFEVIKMLAGENDYVYKSAIRSALNDITWQKYWELVSPNEDNKDFLKYLMTRNEYGTMAGRIYGEDKEGLIKFLQVSFLLAVKDEVAKIYETIIETQKNDKITARFLLWDILEYINEKYHSSWL